MNTDRIYLVLVPLLRPVTTTAARRRREQFEGTPLPPGRVVFLGDSITAGGLWECWFPELPTCNRGINGDTTEDVARRLGSAINEPAAVSLLIGTNDLHGSRRLHDLDGIARRARDIVAGIRRRAPETTVILNSVLPRTPHFAPRIQSLNERYRQVAAETDSTYLDLWPALADARGALRREYTVDNLHLTPPGYRAWSDVLRPHLAPFAVVPAHPTQTARPASTT